MTFVAADTNAVIHRAFHRASSQGEEPLRVFCDMMASLIGLLKPTRLICAVDSPKSFRRALSPAYKANRPKLPEGFGAYIESCIAALHAAGVTTACAEGYEGDDVAAAIAGLLPRGQGCVMCSVDSDWAQLVTPLIHVFDPSRLEYLDPATVQKRWGVEPKMIPQLWGLIGTENLPGCKGVGQERAVALLQRFGTIDGIYASLEHASPQPAEAIAKSWAIPRVGPKCVQALIDCKADVEEAWRMATLDRDAPVRLYGQGFAEHRGGSVSLQEWDVILDIESSSPLQVRHEEIVSRLHRQGPPALHLVEGWRRETSFDDGPPPHLDCPDDEIERPHAVDTPDEGESIPIEQATAQLESLIAAEEAELAVWEQAVIQKRALIECWRQCLVAGLEQRR